MTADPLFPVARAGWTWEPLGEVCRRGGGDIQTGPFGSQLHASDYVTVGVPSIMPQNISQDRVDADGIARIKPSDAERLARYLVRPGDIVYSRRGDVERRALITEKENGWLCGTGCLRVRFGEGIVDPLYASYFLSHPASREWVVRHAVGATMPNLNTTILGALPFLLPPGSDQRAIAAVLGALDDKIEQNRRTTRVLERLARAIFRAWFVDFEPVKAKAEGGTSFPSMPQDVFNALPISLTDSAVGPVPVGWEVGVFGDVLVLAYGSALKADDRRPGRVPVFGSNGQVGWHDQAIAEGPGIIVGRKGNPGTVNWSNVPFFPIDTTFFVQMQDGRSTQQLLYHQLLAADLKRLSTDSAVPGINRNIILAEPVLVPPSSLRRAFSEIVQTQWEAEAALAIESRKLAEMRDYLLPGLLNGNVRIEVVNG